MCVAGFNNFFFKHNIPAPLLWSLSLFLSTKNTCMPVSQGIKNPAHQSVSLRFFRSLVILGTTPRKGLLPANSCCWHFVFVVTRLVVCSRWQFHTWNSSWTVSKGHECSYVAISIILLFIHQQRNQPWNLFQQTCNEISLSCKTWTNGLKVCVITMTTAWSLTFCPPWQWMTYRCCQEDICWIRWIYGTCQWSSSWRQM